MPEFYIRPMFDRKIFFRDFCMCVGGGAGQRPSPVSYAYGWAPGPPPAKSGPERRFSYGNKSNPLTSLVALVVW